jgi:hypothetical protein
MIKTKNHHIPDSILVAIALKRDLANGKITTNHSHRSDFGSLLQETADCEPSRVAKGELVDQKLRFFDARVGIRPLVLAQSAQDEERNENTTVGESHHGPGVQSERVSKREETWRSVSGFLRQDADS